MNGARVDVAFDGVGGSIGRDAFDLLRPGGRLCMFGMASGSFTAISERQLTGRGVTQLRGSPPHSVVRDLAVVRSGHVLG